MAGRALNWAAPFEPTRENRNPAEFPTLQTRSAGPIAWPRKKTLVNFPKEFESYFNDRVGFRQELLEGYAAARLAGLVPDAVTRSVGGATSETVLIGRDDWLYLGGKGMLDLYANRRPYTPDELETWRSGLRARRDWLAERGSEFLFFVPPDKHSIYPEHLPRSVRRRPGESRLDQLATRLTAADGVDFLDVRAVLLSHRPAHRLYFQGDTHWNALGARLAHEALIERLAVRFPKLDTPTSADYTLGESREYVGDLAVMLKRLSWPEPGNHDVVLRRPPRAVFRDVFEPLGPGDYGNVRRSEKADAPAGSAVVIHDSFFFPLQPWFSEQFRRVTYVSNADDRFPVELIECERPDVVVWETVERNLMRPLPPISLPRNASREPLHTAERASPTDRR